MFFEVRKKIRAFITTRKRTKEINPDEIFLDSSNLPEFNKSQFEGRLEQPISRKTTTLLFGAFLVLFLILGIKVWVLQIAEGEAHAIQGENNRLQNSLLFATRGVIYDRNGVELAWNIATTTDQFARRRYTDAPGFGHLLGYVQYPLKDKVGIYYQTQYVGLDGVEKVFDEDLSGKNGVKIVEINALDEIQSESTVRYPERGHNVTLSIDARVQAKLQELIAQTARSSNFAAGAGILMDVESGEVLAMTSVPEFSPQVLSEGTPVETIASYVEGNQKPFLNRVTSGLYTPGSIVKPFIALGVLQEGLIDPEAEILSTGELVVPNPFFPDQPSIFKDWRAHGLVNMREAIGVSSNVYFYEVAGGFEDQEGLGIERLEAYVRMFGLGEHSNGLLPSEARGVIPNPAWKEENFPGDIWRIGDTYHTAIGQYGFQISPLQAVRGIAAIANKGTLLTPTLLKDDRGQVAQIAIDQEHFDVVHEGMRFAVTDGTAQGLQLPGLPLAAKTGTAEVGVGKEYIHSWAIGFFPYEEPRYAFAVLMERAPAGTLTGAVFVARNLLSWMQQETPEYIKR